MDHDRLFKELLTTFFHEFLELFFEDIADLIDRTQPPRFLDKEIFGELTSDRRRELDLVALVKLVNGDAHFLVHMEPQSQRIDDFPEKMFRYFAKLWDRHGLRVYPIAILSFESPREIQESQLGMRFPGLNVLDFRFSIVQLNRLDWKAFVTKPNPVASALMARMKFPEEDRPRVKLQCLRLLATLRLEPAKSALISRFVDNYLPLKPPEVRIFDEILETLPEMEQQDIMQITTSWKEEGRLVGRHESVPKVVPTALHALHGDRAKGLTERLQTFDLATLQKLDRQIVSGAQLENLEATV